VTRGITHTATRTRQWKQAHRLGGSLVGGVSRGASATLAVRARARLIVAKHDRSDHVVITPTRPNDLNNVTHAF